METGIPLTAAVFAVPSAILIVDKLKKGKGEKKHEKA